MKITIEHHNDQFNVCLATKEGVEPFITIKGCRLVNGRNGAFVSWPARKLDSGKYWNHVYASEAFGAAVLEAVNASIPASQKAPAPRAPARPTRQAADDDIPFN